MQTRKKLLLRIENSLWEEITRWAADDFRSINAQIEFLLREAVRQKTKTTRKNNSKFIEKKTTAKDPLLN